MTQQGSNTFTWLAYNNRTNDFLCAFNDPSGLVPFSITSGDDILVRIFNRSGPYATILSLSRTLTVNSSGIINLNLSPATFTVRITAPDTPLPGSYYTEVDWLDSTQPSGQQIKAVAIGTLSIKPTAA